ncbi:MAG: HAMP domain-containing sensor histidine kinase [Usitatibacter sp.]
MASFIIQNMEEIVAEWESFARNLSPETAKMDSWALRDHAKPMLEAIAKDIETSQTDRQQAQKSKGLGPAFKGGATAAAAHGLLRQSDGFDMPELVAEFRALRATVLRLWIAHEGYGDPDSAYEMARFNEAIDQALAESVASYSAELGKSRAIFLAILGHDLRSPLHAVASASTILSNSPTDAQRHKAAAAVTNGVAAMSGMIADLLEFTQSSLGKGIPITPTEANIESICKEVVNEVSHVYPKTAFRFESAGRLDGLFDRARMHQAVSNLLNNAVHHGRQDSPVFPGAEWR